MTFRGRLIVAVTSFTLVTFGAAFAVLTVVVNRDQERQLDRVLLERARVEAKKAVALGGAEPEISNDPGPAADDTGPLTKYVAIFDVQSGNVVAYSRTFHGDTPPLQELRHAEAAAFDFLFGEERLRGMFVGIPGRSDRLLLLAAPRTDLDADAAFLLHTGVVTFIVSLLWVALVARWIIRRLTRVHASVATIARSVAQGDLSARMEVDESQGEAAELARDVNEIIGRLSALLTSQKEFIAHASHELRSPLTALYGEISMALYRPQDAASYRAALEEAMESTKRLSALADDLLALARAANAQFESEPVPISRTVDHAVRTLEREALGRGVEITVAGECRTIEGRPGDLERLFRNLVENAVRHSPPGGTVGVRLADEGGFVTVTVSDQGPGVPADERSRIFDPFYRGKRAMLEDRPGAGLGLAIAQKIAHAHGGEVTLAADCYRGARFVVRLSAGNSFRGDPEAVAPRAHRFEHSSGLPELAAQPADLRIDDARARVEPEGPDLFDQRVARQQRPGPMGEDEQQQ